MNITWIHLRTIMHKNTCRWSPPCVSKQLWSAFSYSNWRSFIKQKSATKDAVNLQNGLSSTTAFLSSPSTAPYSQAFSHKALSDQVSSLFPFFPGKGPEKKEKIGSRAIRYSVRKDRSKQTTFHFHNRQGGSTTVLKVCALIHTSVSSVISDPSLSLLYL